jgi:hypothetical protein
MPFNSARDATLLMLQWAVWKHLGALLIMDGSHMQRLAEQLAQAFYDEGMRFPLDDDPEQVYHELNAALTIASRAVTEPPLTLPQQVVTERTRKVACVLSKAGWRKYAA